MVAVLTGVLNCSRLIGHREAQKPDKPGRAEPGEVVHTAPGEDRPFLAEAHMRMYLTGYSYWDNTPPQSAAIAHPLLHEVAGGAGTYSDPVTIAVGHKIENDTSVPDYAPGTLFYLPRLRKYAIVEDVCGDGDTPQNGPCYIGYRGNPWIDVYIGGELHDLTQSKKCARSITGLQQVIMHPQPIYPTMPGEVLSTNCGIAPSITTRRLQLGLHR